jgi:hypothetical protein
VIGMDVVHRHLIGTRTQARIYLNLTTEDISRCETKNYTSSCSILWDTPGGTVLEAEWQNESKSFLRPPKVIQPDMWSGSVITQ